MSNSLYPGYENQSLFWVSTLAPKDRFPYTCPCLVSVPHTNGKSFVLRTRGSACQKSSSKEPALATIPVSSTNKESAPRNNSCQRSPSRVISTTCSVLVVLDWAKSSKEKSISPSKMNLNGFINSNELVGNLKMNLEMKYRNFRRSLSPASHEDCWIILL